MLLQDDETLGAPPVASLLSLGVAGCVHLGLESLRGFWR